MKLLCKYFSFSSSIVIVVHSNSVNIVKLSPHLLSTEFFQCDPVRLVSHAYVEGPPSLYIAKDKV